jgi:hypothetical protein
LNLADVYQIIGYYLKYNAEFREYFKTRELEEKTLLADPGKLRFFGELAPGAAFSIRPKRCRRGKAEQECARTSEAAPEQHQLSRPHKRRT